MVRPNTPAGLCIRCKGSRNLCGKSPCPIIAQHSVMKSIPFPEDILKQSRAGANLDIFSASPPSFFVGYQNYPAVNVGPMLPHSLDTPLEVNSMDAPETWLVPGSDATTWKGIMDVVRFRSALVRTTHKVQVREWQGDKILSLGQQIAMAEKPVGTEVKLQKVHINIEIDDHAPPSGPIGSIDTLRITENPKVHKKVDYVVGDTDLKASDAIFKYLYKDARIPVSDITRVLSAGLLGVEDNRKLVPTRWSITAVDDTVSKNLVERIRFLPELGEHLLYETSYLGNTFYIMFIPRPWLYEMMESWAPHSIWRLFDRDKMYVIVQDHEFNEGRTTYASNITGAYYAARLGVAEHLVRMGRQAAVMVIREVDSSYLLPLGVWVIRQAIRDALARPAKKFNTLKDIFTYMKPRLKVPLNNWLHASSVLPYVRMQTTLDSFVRAP